MYKNFNKFIKVLLCLMSLPALSGTLAVAQQYPGGVATGTTRGYKVDYYNGTFSNQSQFGAGTTNAVPGNYGYTNKITGTEFNQIDDSYYALEYTGIVEIPVAGNYTFSVAADDRIWLYIDDILIVQAVSTTGTQSSVVNLTAGDHTIKVKYYELAGSNNATLQIANGPSGSNITTATNLDGRFVRYEGAKLTAWYKGDNLTFSAGNVNGFVNQAPDFSGTGNLSRTGSGTSQSNSTTLVNFNPGVRFDGDDRFRALTSQQPGLSYRGATKTMFLVNQYVSNVGQTGAWMFYHGDNSNSQRIGFFKNNTSTQFAVAGSGNTITSAYTANEPKMLHGFVSQELGGTASTTQNPLTVGGNGINATATNHVSNVDAESDGLTISDMNNALLPEAIYYPFELSENQRQRVNSYLAIKYGIALPHNYLSAANTIVYNQATNTGYTNRIFGIARENAQGLYQKQSQSQMKSLNGSDFLVLAKGAIAASNAANTGALADGDFVLIGDNGTALNSQTTEIPASYATSAGCAVSRVGREWKAQVTGNPGALTFSAGQGTILFKGSATAITMLIDRDGDGDFTTGTVDAIPANSVLNGVATFENVSINNGDVITYAWTVVAPGGVANGLKLWAKADDLDLATGNIGTWNDLSPNQNNLVRAFGQPAGAGVRKDVNIFNYNPAIRYGVNWGQGMETTNSLGMNGDNTFAEFYVLKGLGASSLDFNEIITLGGANHRWENSGTSLSGKYGLYGNGVAQSSGSGALAMGQLGLYNSTHSGTAALLRVNGETVHTRATTQSLSLSGSFIIGSDVDLASGGSGIFNTFYSPELIVYSDALSEAEIARVNTYLAVKYSIPLANGTANYVAANGSIIWPAHATYKNDIFGIGRDDCSGLLQKQSTAWNESTTNNLAIALGAIAATNEANSSAFATNNQFLVVAHDGGALNYTSTNLPAGYSSCNGSRYARSWKVANTGNVAGVQLRFGNATFPLSSNWSNVQLAIDVDGDADFTSGTVNLITPSSLNAGVATFDNVTIPDGAVFTLVFTVGYPGGISAPISDVGTGRQTIGGVVHTNGLKYEYYTVTNPGGTNTLLNGANQFNTTLFNANLRSTGYHHNTDNFHTQFQNFQDDNFAVVLKGKIYIPSTTATWRFRAPLADDRFALVIGNQVIFNTTTSGTATSIDISLTAGYHDILVIGQENSGGQLFNLEWNNGSGTGYGIIPNANFFTTMTGMSAWHMADDNLLNTLNEGAQAAGRAWYDLSGNANHLSSQGGNFDYYQSTASQLSNYNPVLNFRAERFNGPGLVSGFAYGNVSRSLFVAATNTAASGTETIFTGYGNRGGSANGTTYGFSRLGTGILQLFTRSNNFNDASGAFYPRPALDVLSTTLNGTGVSIFANNGLRSSGTLGSIPSTRFGTNATDEYQVGSSPTYTNYYMGKLNEVIYYPWELNTEERHRINSYLAIKWGTTLDQTTPTNYVASDGSVIWNAATATTFNKDITVIGRDDCGALNQKQSTSTDGDDIVSMGIGSTELAVNNLVNTNSFDNDKTFMSFAHNGVNVSTTTVSNMPTGLSGCYTRLQREWKVQSVGSVGNVSIEMGKKDFLTINAATYKPLLLISNTPGDYSGATVVENTNVLNGKAYFNDVALTNGQYFTLAYIEAAPGGVKSNMTVWFNSDYDAFTDVAQTTYVQNDGDNVASINNIKFGASFTKVEQSNAAYQPKYYKSAFNYNAGILFDGSNDVLRSAGNINTLDYRSNAQLTSVLAGYNLGSGTQNVFWFHDDGGGVNKTAIERNQAFWNSSTNLLRNPTLTDPEIYSYLNTNGPGLGYRLLSNLNTVGGGTTNSTSTFDGVFRIGSQSLTGGGNPANFYLGEFVIYNDDKGAANSYDMKRMHSYLAIKYGFTLGNVAIGGSYIASDGTVTYDYASHWNRITGIGMDDCSALDQKQSFSQVISGGALVKISNDPAGMAVSNKENTAKFTADKSFLVFGDDDGSLTWTGDDAIVANGQSMIRLNRTWRVKETGTVGTVYLEVPDDASALPTKLPTEENTVYLLVSNTASFANPLAAVEMTPNGTDWSVNYDFADAQYYTFATQTTCLGPGGITEGLTSWFKTDDMTVGSVGTGVANALVDRMGNNNLATTGSGTYNVVAASPASNYNKHFAITAGGSLVKTGLSQNSLASATEGSAYAVGFSDATYANNGLFGMSYSNADPSPFGTYDKPWFRTTVSGIIVPTPGQFHVYGTIKRADTLLNHYDGTNVITPSFTSTLSTSNAYNLRIGSRYTGTGLTYTNTDFAEGFTYNRGLSEAEREVLGTYLAIKYGVSKNIGYYSPAYDGTNAASTTLYSVTDNGYIYRMFGLGRHDAGCLLQKQSRSVGTGSLLKMSVSNTIESDNSLNTGTFVQDLTYVMAGDNNGAVNWTTAVETPALYGGTSCVAAYRLTREWRMKGFGADQQVMITVPDNSSSEATKLPVLPSGATGVYMIVNDTSDFSINANQVEIPMTLNTGTNEWEANYTVPASLNDYQFFTFVSRTDIGASTPVAIPGGVVTDGSVISCDSLPYTYYKGTGSYADSAILAVDANGNTFAPTEIRINNQGTLTGGSGIFSNSGSGYYESTDGTNTLRITKRLHTVVAPGTYSVNGGVVVRIYYTAADLAAMQSDAFAGGAIIERQGWFKSPESSATATVASMSPTNITAQELTPIASGTEDGVAYVEFLVNSFSTFGYFVKTTPEPLPVELLSFTATADGDCKVNLSWKSGIEHNLARYYVEQSTDAYSFTTIGEVAAKGSNSDYRYATEVSTADKLFYRLKMLDRDGRYKHSSIAMVQANCKVSALRVYPNPANESVFVAGLEGNETIELLDYTGRLLKRSLSKATTHELSLSEHAAGLYLIKVINSNGSTATFKVVKH
ncbi:MAG: T9SS type A sorting domain-containing protein [Taibaiella sp.]|nr:T9SS type A sorting domain-containing protein [Taibaiella sp.]